YGSQRRRLHGTNSVGNWISARMHEAFARAAMTASEKRQMVGGCVGGLLTYPCNLSPTKDGRPPSIISGREIAAENNIPVKLKHFSEHVKEVLLSSGGQHGMSALSCVDISVGVMETTA